MQLNLVRSALVKIKGFSMTANFVNLIGSQQGAIADLIINVRLTTGEVLNRAPVALYMNGILLSRQQTDGSGNATFPIKVTQSGKYNFVAYLLTKSLVPSIISTPSIATSLQVSAVTVSAKDQTNNSDLMIQAAISSSNSAIKNLITYTPVTVLIPTLNPSIDTVTATVSPEPGGANEGLVGNANAVTSNLSADKVVTFNYLPFRDIFVASDAGGAFDISAPQDARLAKVSSGKYHALDGSQVTITGKTTTQNVRIVGWRFNNYIIQNPAITFAAARSFANLIISQINRTVDVSDFATNANGWQEAATA